MTDVVGAGRVLPPAGAASGSWHVLAHRDGAEAAYLWLRPAIDACFWLDGMERYTPEVMGERGWRYGRVWTVNDPQQGYVPDVPAEPTMTNIYGQPVKTRLVPERVRLEDQTVREMIARAEAVRRSIVDFKVGALGDIGAFLELLDERYGAKRGGRRGGVQLDSYDGLLRVQVSSADSLAFGPELTAAKALIDECITKWSSGADANLQVIVNDAFRIGTTGKIRVDRVMGLRQLEIDDDTWRQAMLAVGDALRVQASREYIRFYRRANVDARFEQISLDMSRV